VLRRSLLALVLGLTAARSYSGPVGYDWPYLRGSDQFSHAVMTEQILAHGSYPTYLIYPPGFSTFSAVICRFSGLSPLRLYPAAAPALLVLTAVAAYALAAKLWGYWAGLAAAVLSGLVLTGAYTSLAEGRYPDLTAAYFLLVMAVAALITLYQRPSVRSALLVVVISASVVLYHSVATLYLAVILAAVGLAGLVFLLARGAIRPGPSRGLAVALTGALAGVAVLSAVYAGYTYLHGGAGGGHAATSSAVNVALGSQPVLGAAEILQTTGAQVVWLGLFGLAAVAGSLRWLRRPRQVLTVLTLILWCGLMYLGSRVASDGFPQRFENDLGAPLAVLGGFGLCLVLRAAIVRVNWQPAARRHRGVLAALAAGVLLYGAGMLGVQNAMTDSGSVPGGILDDAVASAGQWLHDHNTGGNIITTALMNPGVTNRAVLAMGGYTGLQSYTAYRTLYPRSLPTAGAYPLFDSLEVLRHPETCRTFTIFQRQHIRYIVLYYYGHQTQVARFQADQALYRKVFSNKSVYIFVPKHAPAGCGTASR
jgi:hypothetical protein